MRRIFKYESKTTRKSNVPIVFLLYWLVLIFWQNINPGSTGTLADTIIKIALLAMLAGYLLLNATFRKHGSVLVVIFVINMLISFFAEPEIGIRALLNYFFPVFIVVFSIYLGSHIQITKKQFLLFLKLIIAAVLYMAVYAVFDTPEKFTSPLSLTNAYGNELSSFFISNHEYALYLTSAIIGCLICLELDEQGKKTRKLLYFIVICFFLYNLILTFSRTFLLGTVCFILIYALLNKRSLIRNLVVLGGVGLLLLIWLAPEVNRFFYEIVLKENTLAGRDSLSEQALRMYSEGDLAQQIWGFGASNVQNAFRTELGHGSAHNAYFQILLCFGVCGLIAIVGFLFSCAKSFWKLIKINRLLGIVFFAQILMAAVVMLFNTCTLFFSSCDSFFFTMFMILVPLYAQNSLQYGNFNDREGI